MVLTTSKEVGLKVEVGIGFRNAQGQRRVKLGWLEELGMWMVRAGNVSWI